MQWPKEEGQTTQLTKEEGLTTHWPKEQTTIYIRLHRKLMIEQHEPQLKSGSELLYSGRVSSFISGTCRATIVTNPMISHE